MPATPASPARDCPLCPRLVAYRTSLRAAEPGWHNAPVPSFGDSSGRLLVVGLAPGVRGANRTGRPFTGDYAGTLLYETLIAFGFATGKFAADPADGLTPIDCRIVNAVRCVPPQNKPEPAEIRACNDFLRAEIAAMPRLRVILALGLIAHQAVLRAHGMKLAAARFAHGAQQRLADGVLLADSYHVSRYNTNTGRLTEPMFAAVVGAIRAQISG